MPIVISLFISWGLSYLIGVRVAKNNSLQFTYRIIFLVSFLSYIISWPILAILLGAVK